MTLTARLRHFQFNMKNVSCKKGICLRYQLSHSLKSRTQSSRQDLTLTFQKQLFGLCPGTSSEQTYFFQS